jgi:phosphohistidine phosphatase
MKLYLVRHARPEPAEVDPERPLSARGRSDIQAVAVFLRDRAAIAVGEILHSGKTRAQQTAQVIAECIGPQVSVRKVKGLHPNDDPSTWVERLATEAEDTMIVGHLPFLDRLAGLLICRRECNRFSHFAAAGVVCLERDDEGNWILHWMIEPGLVRWRPPEG